MKVKSILVSQPVPAIVEKSPFYEIITKFGAKVDFQPFIKIEGINLKEFRTQRIEVLDHSAIVFTSRTTVDHFFRICDQARVTIPETMKYFCNTEAVALYLQKYIVFRKRKIFFANGTFADFMELLVKNKDEKMLLTLSEPHKVEVPQTMTKLKLNFDKVILARTVSCDLSGVEINKYDLLVLYSPSEITSLKSNFPAENLPAIATFGEGTARSAIEAGLAVSVMAPTPVATSMAKAIELYIENLAKGETVPAVVIQTNTQAEDFLKSHEAKPIKKVRAKKTVAKAPIKKNDSTPKPRKS